LAKEGLDAEDTQSEAMPPLAPGWAMSVGRLAYPATDAVSVQWFTGTMAYRRGCETHLGSVGLLSPERAAQLVTSWP